MKNPTITGKTQIIRKASRIAFLLVIALLLTFKPARAQGVTVNIVSQPLWGPVNYDYVEYYYLPAADVYYYVPTRQFIYLSNGNWLYATSLPPAYHVDLYRTHKVVINEPKPYIHHHVYVSKYKKYKTVKSSQVVIRDSRDTKYYVVKGHPNHGKVKAAKPAGSKSGNVKTNSSKSGNVKTGNSKSKGAKQGNSKNNGKGKK